MITYLFLSPINFLGWGLGISISLLGVNFFGLGAEFSNVKVRFDRCIEMSRLRNFSLLKEHHVFLINIFNYSGLA